MHYLEKFNIPGIAGVVDGVLFHIKKPSNVLKNEYICRKMFPAINYQVCCRPDNMIYQASIRWPGSTHDARVYAHSSLRKILEALEDGTAVLGDSTYLLQTHLLTPVQDLTCAAEENFNRAHCSARVKIEQTFGILKAR